VGTISLRIHGSVPSDRVIAVIAGVEHLLDLLTDGTGCIKPINVTRQADACPLVRRLVLKWRDSSQLYMRCTFVCFSADLMQEQVSRL